LDSQTFARLLQQAEQMAKEYASLREKYVAVKAKYKDMAQWYEGERQKLLVPWQPDE
jgi:hypothetical protein